MTRLAYLESLSRRDKEFKTKHYSDVNITKLIQEVKRTNVLQPTRRYAIEANTTEIDWATIAFNTAIALNPTTPPLARLRSGLKVAEELTFIDDTPLSVLEALEKLDLV